MKRGITINLIITLVLTIIAFNSEGFAMAKRHAVFVDKNYEGKIIKGQPNGHKGTRWWYDHKDFHVIVNYPVDHRTDWPLKQWMGVQVGDHPPQKGKFKILKWQLIANSGQKISVKFEVKEIDDPWNREFDTNAYPIAFFADIPKDVKDLMLDFKIQIKMQDGSVHVVEEKISLKKASFEVGLFDK